MCTVLEFITTVNDLLVVWEGPKYFGSSNIYYKDIPFELSTFRSLEIVKFSQVFLGNLIKADDVRDHISSLTAHKCELKNIADVLLCDNIHKDWSQTTSGQIWSKLQIVDLSNNLISVIGMF